MLQHSIIKNGNTHQRSTWALEIFDTSQPLLLPQHVDSLSSIAQQHVSSVFLARPRWGTPSLLATPPVDPLSPSCPLKALLTVSDFLVGDCPQTALVPQR